MIERRWGGPGGVTVNRRADGAAILRGHAAVFDSLSQDLGGFREKIAPGAFAKTVNADVRALFNHDPSLILGRTSSGTLALREDRLGLAVEIDPPHTATARHIVEAIRRGDVSQMSFGFRTVADHWERDAGGEVIRTLLEVELLDVSPVAFAAYLATDVHVDAAEPAARLALIDRRKRERAVGAKLARMKMRLRLAESG